MSASLVDYRYIYLDSNNHKQSQGNGSIMMRSRLLQSLWLLLLPAMMKWATCWPLQANNNKKVASLSSTKRSSNSILTIQPLVLSSSNSKTAATWWASGGHDGCISIWEDKQSTLPFCIIQDLKPHGSIFSMHIVPTGVNNNEFVVVTGHMDRRAIYSQMIIDNNNGNKVAFEPCISCLEDHTGWVRAVKCIPAVINNSNNFSCLSIGCNFINGWIPSKTNEPLARVVDRCFRMDGGPSPDEDEDFRRHDILCIDYLQSGLVVAGLVDGSLRVFDMTMARNADPTVSMDIVPIASLGPTTTTTRVMGIHALSDKSSSSNQFVAVHRDGWWQHCQIHTKECTIQVLQTARLLDDHQSATVTCSTLRCHPSNNNGHDEEDLVVGTSTGHILWTKLDGDARPQTMWQEQTCITAMSSSYSATRGMLCTGTSEGKIKVFSRE